MAFVLFSGTTFVVKENGQEVGRYEDADGRNEIRVIENEVVRPAVQSAVSPDLESTLSAAETSSQEKLSARIFWKWYVSILAASGVAAFFVWKHKKDME